MQENVHIQACQRGEKESFGHIVQLYCRKAYLAALAMTKNPEDALDASQDAFIRAYRNIRKFEEGRSFYPWFYTILKNCCRNLLQKKRRWEDKSVEKSDIQLDPALLAEQKEATVKLLETINGLAEEDVEILQMKYFQELRYKEIAEILSIPVGTVMSRLYNARSRLKEKMAPWLCEGTRNEM